MGVCRREKVTGTCETQGVGGKKMGGRLILFLLLFLFFGCKTKEYVPVPEYHVRDSVVIKYERDSVFLHDSVYFSIRQKGDTVYSERIKIRYSYRDKLQHDTIIVTHTDSIRIPYPVEVKVRKPWWHKPLALIGSVVIVALSFIVVWLVKTKKN